jgi:hypothetical protein
MEPITDDALTLDIRAHLAIHPDDNAFAVYMMLKTAGREYSLLEVRDAWLRAKLLIR